MTAETRFAGDDLRKGDPKFQVPRFSQYLRAIEQLDRFARDNYGKRMIHLALRWILDRAETNIALWGARPADHRGKAVVTRAPVAERSEVAWKRSMTRYIDLTRHSQRRVVRFVWPR
jgi:aryl-alcohol dehydrogenase-like predicted oxidoreductase